MKIEHVGIRIGIDSEEVINEKINGYAEKGYYITASSSTYIFMTKTTNTIVVEDADKE
jgi:hypothetical protein